MQRFNVNYDRQNHLWVVNDTWSGLWVRRFEVRREALVDAYLRNIKHIRKIVTEDKETIQ